MNRSKFTLVLFLLLSMNFVYSQVGFSAGPQVGYTGPMSDYSGSTIDYYNGTKYGLGGGINLGAIFKVKLKVLNLKLTVNYSSLSNTGNSEPGQGSVDISQSMLVIGAGPEFAFSITGSPVKPYIGVDLLLTSFSGETTFIGVSKVPSGSYQMSSTTRTGLGFGGGILLGIGSKYSLDFGVRLNFHNLMGKSFSGGDARIYSYTSLNDEKDPLYDGDDDKHPIGSSRSISSVQLNLGFLFDF